MSGLDAFYSTKILIKQSILGQLEIKLMEKYANIPGFRNHFYVIST